MSLHSSLYDTIPASTSIIIPIGGDITLWYDTPDCWPHKRKIPIVEQETVETKGKILVMVQFMVFGYQLNTFEVQFALISNPIFATLNIYESLWSLTILDKSK